MAGHAKLSPSAAKRWVGCPGSVSMTAGVVDSGSRAADEGTAGHALFEKALRLGKKPTFWLGEVIENVKVTDEMAGWVTEAVEWVKEYMAGNPGAVLYTEEKVNIGPALGLPADVLWGTSDLFILTPKELVVFDLKLGYVGVEAELNYQLMLYGLGFHHQLGGMFDSVRLVIHQPRAGGAKEYVMTADALESHGRELFAPAAKLALSEGAPLRASEEACKWCPAAGLCPELHKESLAMARQEFGSVETLTKDQLLLLLDKADIIEAALKAARAHASKLLALGQQLPGWKRVAGTKRRAWKDEQAALVKLSKLDPEVAPRSLLTPAQAEKLLGKKAVEEFVHTPVGEPTLVRESDKRTALPPEFEVV